MLMEMDAGSRSPFEREAMKQLAAPNMYPSIIGGIYR